MSESLVVTAVPSESGPAVKASPHMRRNAMAKPMNRLVPTPPASRARLRPRATTWTTQARYPTARVPRNANSAASSSVIAVSTRRPAAAKAATMASLPLLPMWRM
jgi:hypothetical protein